MFSRQAHPGTGTAARHSARRINLTARPAAPAGFRQTDLACDRCVR
jgi:hypothetical protein